MNSVCLVGRIVRDPEVRVTQRGDGVCTFSLAVRREYKNSAGEYGSDFFNCVAYRNDANYIGKYCHKGDLLEIGGKLRQRTFEKDGEKRSVVEVEIKEVRNIAPKKSGAEGAPSDGFDEMEPLDEVPF